MSNGASAVPDAFGRKVKRARSLKGWTFKDLAAAIKPAPGKSFLSNIEKGKRPISATTVGKLIKALDLDQQWIDKFLDADVAENAQETQTDRDTDRLIRLTEQDTTAPETAEILLFQLAEKFARGNHDTPATAYNGLKAALVEAADLKARGLLPQNTADQISTLMRRVAELNDQGLPEEAASEVDTALADLDASHTVQKAALLDLGIRQDRIRNNPKSAAARIIAQLRSAAHPGGLFGATHDAWTEWHDRGFDKGVGFDLNTALYHAGANLGRAKGRQRFQTMVDLGNTQLGPSERGKRTARLPDALQTFRDMLAKTPRKL